MNNTNGFYKLDQSNLLFAPNFVISAEFELLKEQKDQYEYPTQGWYWFDTEQLAREFFNLPELQVEQPPLINGFNPFA